MQVPSEPTPLRQMIAAASAALLATVVLAGCGSSGGGAAAAPGTGAESTGIAAAVTSSPAGGKVTCSQITTAEVQPLVDGTVVAPTITAENGTGQQCVFSTAADDGGAVDILVLGGSEATTGYAQDMSSATSPVGVPGVGEKAFRATGDDEVEAIQGDTLCSVTLGSSSTIKGVGPIELANGGHSTLSESDNAIIATALGTLCNQIFGSGNTTPSLSGLS